VAERAQQFVVRRDDGEDFRWRKGNVQKEADAVANAQPAAFFGERNQVVVENPDDVVRLEQRLELLGEHRIDAPVTLVFFAVVTRQVDAVMEDRPEGGVGEAAVILVVVALVQRQGGIGDVAHRLAADIGAGTYLATPAEPDATGLAQRIVDPDRQPARGDLAGLYRRHPVGNHYKS